ncbi:MAG TPA: M14 family zinc carboxypeptidase [Gemmatirosa sp.]|nr:M14 family zinc carboxypeptidase [Gemmatirosa sp.]
MRRPTALALVAALAALASPAGPRALAAQPPIGRALADSVRDDRHFSFEARGPYRANVPAPEALLGYRFGDRNTQFAEQERVLLAIAERASDRVRVEEIGATHEGRRMRLFIVSSPENIARLDAIRADLDRLSDPRGVAPAELDALARRTPTVVWISESVHGNESPGFETAMPLLFQLAASLEPATLAALRNAIVVLNPSSNPDGHERFTVWYNSVARSDPTNDAYEHREPWSVQGRFNHYRFDMNRDVMASTQPEVQALLRGMLRWHPQTAVDQHGHTVNYFFPPAASPVNANIGAESEKWLSIVGRANAAAFDRYGWMYFVRDQFDLYYPGYWDTWPSLTGATGMTYETDGGGWKGILWRREDGSLLSFRDGIAKHWTTAMATIEAVAGRAAERVRDYAEFRRRAVDAGRTGRMRRVVIEPGDDPQRAAELAAALLRSGIEVRRADQPFSSGRATSYGLGSTASSAAESRRFAAGAYVVDLAQPQGRLARAFLEPAPVLDSAFARTQREKFARNQRRGGANEEYYEFYDITAWSLPVAFGVRAYWTEDAAPVSGALLALPDAPRPGPPLIATGAVGDGAPAIRALAPPPFTAAPTALAGPAAGPYALARSARVLGAEALPVEVGGGIVGGERARSAYLFAPARGGAARLAFHLLAEGVRVGVTTGEIEAGGRTWPRGTYLVRVARNDSSVHGTLDRLARESGVEVAPVNSAYTERAQFGIGSSVVQELERPRVAVLGDDGVSQTGFGALWWSLDRRFGVDFTHLGWSALTGGALSRWNVIVIPDASPGALSQRLGKAGTDRLREWVRAGGTLVTMAGASAWAAREDVALTSARVVGEEKGDSAARAGAASATGTPRSAADSAAPRAAELLAATSPNANANLPAPLPGSHFDAVLDRTHWLTAGYDVPRLTALVGDGPYLRLSREGSNVAVFPTTGPFLRAGFTWPGNTERLLRGTALVVEEPLGRGHVVLFANEPMFRGWWRAMDGLVLNAMVLGPAF